MSIPNPGSEKAIEQGCTCPIMDNGYGQGAYIDSDGKPHFWINDECPIHTPNKEENDGKSDDYDD